MTVSREVTAPAETTWAVVTDMGDWANHISGIQSVERLDEGEGFAVGTRWRETRKMFGKEATEDMEVTSLTPGRSYVVEAESHGAHYVSTITVEPTTEGRSRLEYVFSGQATGKVSRVFSKTIGKLFEGPTRKALEQDLDDIAAEAERRVGESRA